MKLRGHVSNMFQFNRFLQSYAPLKTCCPDYFSVTTDWNSPKLHWKLNYLKELCILAIWSGSMHFTKWCLFQTYLFAILLDDSSVTTNLNSWKHNEKLYHQEELCILEASPMTFWKVKPLSSLLTADFVQTTSQ